MAVTRIWPIRGNINQVVSYAANKSKTDLSKYSDLVSSLHYDADKDKTNLESEQRLLVDGINCDPDIAAQQMIDTKEMYGKTGGIVAYHAYISFKPGEVTPEIAHEIGKRLAKEMWGDRFEVVIATHLNKEHLHNHFVINSVSFADGLKYYDNTANYNLIKKISDRLCEEYNLSVIRNPKGKGKHYANLHKCLA